MKDSRAEPRVLWQPALHLDGVELMTAIDWRSDISVYHETADFCLIESLAEGQGPRNFYRRWDYTASAGEVLLFEPGNAHHARGGPLANFRVLSVPEPLLRIAKQELTGKDTELHLALPKSAQAYAHFDKLISLLSEAAPRAEIQEAFVDALESVITTCAEPERLERPDHGVVRRAREFLEQCALERLDQQVSLDEVVVVSGASGKFTLCRSFRNTMHVGVCAYFKLLKLSRGKALLLEKPQRTVEHIAWDLGYTLSSFSRAFAEQYGISPRQYRAVMGGRLKA